MQCCSQKCIWCGTMLKAGCSLNPASFGMHPAVFYQRFVSNSVYLWMTQGLPQRYSYHNCSNNWMVKQKFSEFGVYSLWKYLSLVTSAEIFIFYMTASKTHNYPETIFISSCRIRKCIGGGRTKETTVLLRYVPWYLLKVCSSHHSISILQELF